MRKTCSLTTFLTVLLALMVFGCGPKKESPKFTGFTETSFSATILTTLEGASEISESKYYKDGDKLRFESKRAGLNMIHISRKDKNLVWVINPDNKTYAEQPYSEAKIRVSEIYMPGRRVKLGEETIDGHPCIKYEFTPTNQPEVKTLEWQAKDLRNFPIRMEGYFKDPRGKVTKSIKQFKDISFNKPADDLFELPKDYKRVANITEVTGIKTPVTPNASGNKQKRT